MPKDNKKQIGQGTYQNDAKDKAIETSSKAYEILANLRQRLNALNQEYLYKQTGLSTPLWYKWQNRHLNAFNSEVSKTTNTTLKEAKNDLIQGFKGIGLTKDQRNEFLDLTYTAAKGLMSSMIQTHYQQVATVSVKVQNANLNPTVPDDGVTTRTLESKRLPPLFDEIRQMQQLHPNGDFGYVSSGGKIMSWESYIERKIRTEASQEIAVNMVAHGYQAGEIFYICSYFGDCAKDHADYQGKIYFDKDWEDNVSDDDLKQKIKDKIAEGMMSIQDVMGEDIWLSTRPNCRHYFQYISVDDVLGITSQSDIEKVLKDHDMAYNGKYQPAKYEALQKQRYNERNIRKYKEQLQQAQIALNNAPGNLSIQAKNKLIADVSYNKSMVSAWQKKQRSLLNNNVHLEREYRREKVNRNYTKVGGLGTGPNVVIEGSGGISTKELKPNNNNGNINAELKCEHKDFYVPPLDEKEFKRLKDEFEKNGGQIIQDEEAQKYLKYRNADAITLAEDLIILKPQPTASEVNEELIHARQKKNGKGLDPTNRKEMLECEIEAARILIANKEKFQITDIENEYNIKRLNQFDKDLEEGNYDKY